MFRAEIKIKKATGVLDPQDFITLYSCQKQEILDMENNKKIFASKLKSL